jgi:aquaporin Z
LAFGLAVVAMAYTIGPISGCHINPAISIAMLAAGKLSMKDTIGYVIVKCIGVIIAAGVLYLILTNGDGFVMPEWGLGINGWGEGYLGNYSMQAALISEFVFTFYS